MYIWIWLLFFSLGCTIKLSDGNYPKGKDNPKPCATPNGTTDVITQLCVPLKDNPNLFEPTSETNCKSIFKDTCPEFNRARCVWFLHIWPIAEFAKKQYPCQTPALYYPACTLYYKASAGGLIPHVWMEVFYVNQYGTNPLAVFSIVELARRIFFYFEDGNWSKWPYTVPDPKAFEGKDWKNLKLNGTTNSSADRLCLHGNDNDLQCSFTYKDIAVNTTEVWKYYEITHPNDYSNYTSAYISGSCVKTYWDKDGEVIDACELEMTAQFHDLTYNSVLVHITRDHHTNYTTVKSRIYYRNDVSGIPPKKNKR